MTKKKGRRKGNGVKFGKPNVKKLKEEYKKSKEQKGEYADFKWWKPKEGKNKIRLVPPLEGTDALYNDYYMHYDIAGSNKAAICLQTFGEDCPVCKVNAELRKSQIQSDRDLAYKQRAQRKRVFQIIDRKNEEAGVQLYAMQTTVYNAIMPLITPPDPQDEDPDESEYIGDITDVKKGTDVIIKRVGTKMEDTEYTVWASRKGQTPMASETLSLKEIRKQMYDLSVLTNNPKSYEELQAMVEGEEAPVKTKRKRRKKKKGKKKKSNLKKYKR